MGRSRVELFACRTRCVMVACGLRLLLRLVGPKGKGQRAKGGCEGLTRATEATEAEEAEEAE